MVHELQEVDSRHREMNGGNTARRRRPRPIELLARRTSQRTSNDASRWANGRSDSTDERRAVVDSSGHVADGVANARNAAARGVEDPEIGRASWRERGEMWGGGV